MGMLERGGEVRTVVVGSRRKRVLQEEVKKHVEAGAALYTDALLSYDGLAGDYAHQVIDHAVKYVDGNIHTNGLENFWSLLKRTIAGTYASVEPFHLFRYLDEQAYRFNNRKMTDAERFDIAVRGIVGKRLTFDVDRQVWFNSNVPVLKERQGRGKKGKGLRVFAAQKS